MEIKLGGKYSNMFDSEISDLDIQSKKTEKLYDETHLAMDALVKRIGDKQMFGGSTPYRDTSEIAKALTGIRQTSVNIIKEKINLKKIVAELDIKDKQQRTDGQNATTNELLMKDILCQINARTNAAPPSPNAISNNNGIEKLQYDEKDIGMNSNDYESIKRFKGNSGN